MSYWGLNQNNFCLNMYDHIIFNSVQFHLETNIDGEVGPITIYCLTWKIVSIAIFSILFKNYTYKLISKYIWRTVISCIFKQ